MAYVNFGNNIFIDLEMAAIWRILNRSWWFKAPPLSISTLRIQWAHSWCAQIITQCAGWGQNLRKQKCSKMQSGIRWWRYRRVARWSERIGSVLIRSGACHLIRKEPWIIKIGKELKKLSWSQEMPIKRTNLHMAAIWRVLCRFWWSKAPSPSSCIPWIQ